MVKHGLLVSLIAVVSVAGCGIRTARARDATLPYHPTLVELARAPRIQPGAPSSLVPQAVAARLTIAPVELAYPQPVGLVYDDDGSSRVVSRVEWDAEPLSSTLSSSLSGIFTPGDGPEAELRSALVNVAVYQFGSVSYARAVLDVRLSRAGNEVHAKRYTAAGRAGDRIELMRDLAHQLLVQLQGDGELVAAMAGGGS